MSMSLRLRSQSHVTWIPVSKEGQRGSRVKTQTRTRAGKNSLCDPWSPGQDGWGGSTQRWSNILVKGWVCGYKTGHQRQEGTFSVTSTQSSYRTWQCQRTVRVSSGHSKWGESRGEGWPTNTMTDTCTTACLVKDMQVGVSLCVCVCVCASKFYLYIFVTLYLNQRRQNHLSFGHSSLCVQWNPMEWAK